MDFNFNFEPGSQKKSALEQFGRNLTKSASEGKIDPIIGRDNEIRRIIRILSRRTKNNPILVGDPGVGKTAIVEGLALKIVAGDVPENLKDKEIIELDVSGMIAGASFQGQFEKRIKDVIKEIKNAKGNLIVFIDEIHTLIGAGKVNQGGMDAAQIFKPMLARGELRLIGATTLDEHRQYIEKDPAFERRMQKIMVNEPTPEEAITILRGIKEKLETYHGVKIHDDALISAVNLSTRYINDRFLPDKAIDLIDEAAAGIQTEMHSKPEELEKLEQKITMLKIEKAALQSETDKKSGERLKEIENKLLKLNEKNSALLKKWKDEKEEIKKISKLKAKIDETKNLQAQYISDGEYEKASKLMYKEIPVMEKELESLEKKIKKSNLIKEDVSEEEIADVISKWTGIPVSKLLKNEKEKLLNLEAHLGKRVKGQEKALKLVSEAILRSKADINDPNRPIGSFVFMGSTGVGKTEVARTLAYELFDDEKNLVRIDMSEYMEEHSVSRLIGSPPGYIGFEAGGQLTEAVRQKPYSIVLFDEIEKAHPKVLDILLQILDEGRLTDGRGKTINFKNTIVIMTTNVGSQDALLKGNEKKIIDQFKKTMRPEFINRIDEIIVFNPLTKPVIKEIVVEELKRLSQRIKKHNIDLTFKNDAIDKIVKEGYDINYGARPIKKYIQKYIQSELAKELIKQSIKDDKSYVCSVENNKFIFKEKLFS